jgi:hypothetical protein
VVDVVLVGELRKVDLGRLVAALQVAHVDRQLAGLAAHGADRRDERLALAVGLLLRVVVVEARRLRRLARLGGRRRALGGGGRRREVVVERRGPARAVAELVVDALLPLLLEHGVRLLDEAAVRRHLHLGGR